MRSPSLLLLLAAGLVAACTDSAEPGDAPGDLPDACDACDPTDDGGIHEDTGPALDARPTPDAGSPDGASPDAGSPDGASPDADVPPSFDPEGDDDGDGILNGIEGTEDTDGDGVPDYLDLDSDGDGIPDAEEYGMPAGSGEPPLDTDGDGVPDYLDLDSDGDGIGDFWEGAGDADGDGVPNYRDLDSDGDGWPDEVEYGRAAGELIRPLDTDGDGVFDFLDLDSDSDGIPDADELGCPGSTERLVADSDGDGISDLVEVFFTSDTESPIPACDPDRGIEDEVDFYFELPFEGDTQTDELDFVSDVRNADVHFNLDTTGSMSGELGALRADLRDTIIPGLETAFDDVAWGISQFDDFPCNGHGSGNDRPLIVRQRITRDVARAIAGVDALTLHSGGDFPESGFEALFQIATGVGRRNTGGCLSSRPSNDWLVPPFDPAEDALEGIQDGELGGVGFRDGAVPVVVHITDALTHAKGEAIGSSAGRPYAYGASRPEALLALRNLGARVIGVNSASSFNGDEVRAQLEDIARSSRATVPPCAWDPVRPDGCDDRACCTGPDGTGRSPDSDNLCPLVYDIEASGRGLGTSSVAGIRALVDFATFDLITRTRRDEEEFARSGIDTRCFIDSIRPLRATPPDRECVRSPEPLDIDADGLADGFAGVMPGSILDFEIAAVNRCVEPDVRPRVYLTWIDIVEPRGSLVLDSRLVTILVPPSFKP